VPPKVGSGAVPFVILVPASVSQGDGRAGMRRHAGVITGASIAAVGLLLAVAALSGFAVRLPPVRPTSALGASWLMIGVVLVLVGSFAALAARGLELVDEEQRPARPLRPVRYLRPTR
jgi:hypothetical protein